MSDETNDAFLTFVLGDVAYAVDVCSVREVLTYETVTRVPRTAAYLKGVLNIRGTVIPVIDLRILFNISVLSLNLSVAMAAQCKHVILCDLDFGGANLHTIQL